MRKDDDQPVNSVWDAMGNPGCGCVVILGSLMLVGVLIWAYVGYAGHPHY